MNLPKWIYDLGAKQYDVRESSLTVIEDHRKIYQALAIAWEALEIYTIGNVPNIAEDAMHCIRALGGEEGQ